MSVSSKEAKMRWTILWAPSGKLFQTATHCLPRGLALPPRFCANSLMREVSVESQSVLGKSVWVGEEGCKAKERLTVLTSRPLQKEAISCRSWPQHTGPLPRSSSVSFPHWPMLKCYLLKLILWDRFQLPPFQVWFNLVVTVNLLKVLPVWIFFKKK